MRVKTPQKWHIKITALKRWNTDLRMWPGTRDRHFKGPWNSYAPPFSEVKDLTQPNCLKKITTEKKAKI